MTYPEHNELAAQIERIARRLVEDVHPDLANTGLWLAVASLRAEASGDQRWLNQWLKEAIYAAPLDLVLRIAAARLDTEAHQGSAAAKRAAPHAHTAGAIYCGEGETV